MRRRLISLAAVLSLVASGLLAAAFPAGSADRLPSLRLLGAARHMTLTRFPGEPPSLIPGTHLAAIGGPLEIRIKRTKDGLEIAQVMPTTGRQVRVVRRLPAWTVRDLSEGLHNFFAVTVKDRDGEVVMRARAPLCISGSFDQARVDDTGPETPHYPPSCFTSPLAKAAVWGLDRGWAVRAPQYVPTRGNLPDGRYEVTVAVTSRYAELFDVSPRYDSFTSTMRLETLELPPCEDENGNPCEPPCESPDGEPCEPCDSPAGPPCEPCETPEGVPCEECVSPDGLCSEEFAGSSPGAVEAHDEFVAESPKVAAQSSGLPDLVALPAHGITAYRDQEVSRDVIAFGATVWNRGPGPLVVEGYRRPGRRLMDAYQYLYDKGRRIDKLDAGTLEFDTRDGHHHWHFTDFARYRLLNADKRSVVRSGKEAFCLAPTDAVDMTLPTANWEPGSTGLATACGGAESIWIREILDVGWGDTYHQSLPGQSFDITDLDNGTYFVEVVTNPDGNLREGTRANNVAYRKIRLSGTPGKRVVEEL